MMDKYIFIKRECLNSKSSDPIQLLMKLMKKEEISMHGPEHHILDGACFLTALHNAGMEFDLSQALDEMIERGKKMPGAICGQWGVCGSAASVGAALAIIHETGPLSENQFYKDNLTYVSQALNRIAAVGGPRCCKRNAFLSIQTAIDFVRDNYGVTLPKYAVVCEFSARNRQCIGSRCPFSADRAEKNKYKVAFVCVHNSCRSQIAQALGRHLAGDVFESFSAGTEPISQINQDAVRLMKQLYGIDMNKDQYSKSIESIPAVNAVITMGCNVACPSLPCEKREDWGLEDPTGKSDEVFIRVIKEIEKDILLLKAEIEGKKC